VILDTPEFWGRLLEIGLLNMVLSGDNAVVIALAVRALPGRQRLLGQIGGTLGAVVLRLLFIGVISMLLRVPLLRLVGSLLLIWIAYRLVRPVEATGTGTRYGASFWESVWIIVVADITMSLDNVLAVAGAAHGDMLLVGLGVGMSVPIVVWGSGVLAGLMNRYPWIIWAGGGLLGYVAGDMLLEDPLVVGWVGAIGPALEYPVPSALAAVLTGTGWWMARPKRA
jgi:YjbE family integral membrane protein